MCYCNPKNKDTIYCASDACQACIENMAGARSVPFDPDTDYVFGRRAGGPGAPNLPETSLGKPEEEVDHPGHYGGADNPYEVIKVIEAWGLGFNLGNTVKYIGRAGKKGPALKDLEKAAWYLAHEIERRKGKPIPATDLDRTGVKGLRK